MNEHKSEEIKAVALEHGWKAQVQPKIPENPTLDNIEWHLYCIRDNETIHAWWMGERFIEGIYAYGEKRLYPARPGAVAKLLEQNVPDGPQVRKVPWDHDASAYEVMIAVMGKKITWVRRMDGEICSATIFKELNLGNRHFKVYPHRNGMMLDWLDREGFHTVLVDQIMQVD